MNEIECKQQLPPEGQIVFTVIDDGKGRRNEQLLKRGGSLWFVPDGSMYVYYTPTHWRPATTDELQSKRKAAVASVNNAQRIVDNIDAQIDAMEAKCVLHGEQLF